MAASHLCCATDWLPWEMISTINAYLIQQNEKSYRANTPKWSKFRQMATFKFSWERRTFCSVFVYCALDSTLAAVAKQNCNSSMANIWGKKLKWITSPLRTKSKKTERNHRQGNRIAKPNCQWKYASEDEWRRKKNRIRHNDDDFCGFVAFPYECDGGRWREGGRGWRRGRWRGKEAKQSGKSKSKSYFNIYIRKTFRSMSHLAINMLYFYLCFCLLVCSCACSVALWGWISYKVSDGSDLFA